MGHTYPLPPSPTSTHPQKLAQMANLTQRAANIPLPVWMLCFAATAGCDSRAQSLGEAIDRSDGTLPTLVVPRAGTPPVIDGQLTDEAWKRAVKTSPFVSPASGKPAPRSGVQAVLRLAHDATHLFVAFEVLDRNAATPFARNDLDPHLWERASAVELMIAPGDFPDNREYFEVQIDVGGAVWDTRFDDYNAPIVVSPDGTRRFGHQEYNAKLERATAKTKDGYVVELAYPFSTLATSRTKSPPSPGDVWRLNAYSFRDGQRDALAWSPILGKGNFHRASRFGRIAFSP